MSTEPNDNRSSDAEVSFVKSRNEAMEFARDNLCSCALELIEWQDTGVLRDGLVRQLAGSITAWAGEHDALQAAERLIERVALEVACA